MTTEERLPVLFETVDVAAQDREVLGCGYAEAQIARAQRAVGGEGDLGAPLLGLGHQPGDLVSKFSWVNAELITMFPRPYCLMR